LHMSFTSGSLDNLRQHLLEQSFKVVPHSSSVRARRIAFGKLTVTSVTY